MTKKNVLIIIVCFAVIFGGLFIVFSLNNEDFFDINNVAKNINIEINENIINILSSEIDEWKNYTADEMGIEIIYPSNWEVKYFVDELDNYIEIYSDEKIEYTDKLSRQVLQSPLSTITIRNDQLTDKVGLAEWAVQRVNSDSIQKQEVIDINGNSVLRQWVWNQQNSFAFSNINYYVQIGNDILSFRNSIMNEDPTSSQFINAEKIGDEIFNNFVNSNLFK